MRTRISRCLSRKSCAVGHDVLTVQEAGRGGQGIGDAEVLADAIADRRAVLTHNHADFRRLHLRIKSHYGIVSSTQDVSDPIGLAHRIHTTVIATTSLMGMLIRIVRPNPSHKP